MILSTESHFPKLEFCSLDELPKVGFRGVVTTERKDEHRLLELHSTMHERLVVHEVWKDILPNASLLISSAISGGNITERFRLAAQYRSCFLLLEPIKTAFPLPFFEGKELQTVHIPEKGIFSPFLYCYYAHFPNSVVLWDTEESLARKLKLAEEMGFCGYAVQK